MTTPPPPDTGSMNFAELRRSGCCYVDKTMHIGELLGPARGPLLLTRPRRFGKTLTQYTLKSFLELNYEHPGTPNADAEVFDGLAISRDTQLCAQYQSRFPVIFLTLKDVKQSTFRRACNRLCTKVEALYREFAFLSDAPQLTSFQREDCAALQRLGEIDDRDGRREELLISSLLLLAQCLYTVYRRPAYILIDEYDVPLVWAAHYSTADDRSYYERMRDLVFGMLEEVTKTGDVAVHRCLMTSCLRLNPPGSISGLNNLRVLGMHSSGCAQLMGFTQAEVDQLLSVYGFSDRRERVRDWYDGYLCGTTRLYNPWSVMHYCADLHDDPQCEPQNYWVETSSNDFRRYFISELSAESMSALQALLDGEAVALELRRGLDYPDLDAGEYDDRAFFTLLCQAGYLTRAESGTDENGIERYVIPNCEVLDCFREKIHDYFRQSAVHASPRFTELIESCLNGHSSGVQSGLTWLYTHYLDMQAAAARLQRSRGGRDLQARGAIPPQNQEIAVCRHGERELGYQTLSMGVLALFDGTAIAGLTMEHKLGTGRVDISFAVGTAGAGCACLLEFKVARDSSQEALDEAAAQGLEQTRDNGCAAALLDGNPALQVIYSYGIGCRAKSCRVRVEVIRRGQV